jgi:hypothetical protein
MATRSGRVNPGLRAVKEIFMKSVEEQLEIERQKYIAAETKKGFNEAAILTTWKESVMKADTVEHKLSNAKKLTSKIITESGRPAKIARKNGAFVEGSDEGRVESYMRKHRVSFREATIMTGGDDPGPSRKPSTAFNEALRGRWKKHMGGLISESDLDQLVERQIEPK